MPAQAGGTPLAGSALGIGSGVENSNALKGQNRFVVKNLVSPFQGWADSHSDRIPRALLSVSAPSGQQKSVAPKLISRVV